MNKKWQRTFRDYSELEDRYKNRVESAKKIISYTLKIYKKPYIAFSGGKDSTVMLHLILQQKPDIMVLYWDYGRYYIPRDIHKEILNNAKIIGAKNLRIETSIKYDELGKNAINILGQEMLKKLVPQLIKEDYDSVFVGLRKEESKKRKRRIESKRTLTKLSEIFPVQDFSWIDIWGYIISNNLPYLSHYAKYAPIIGWDKARFTTLFDPEFDKFGCSNIDGVLSWKYRYTNE